ncbi:MAG: nucleotide exchange factor GrpE [Chloroflexi bacterium]|nr:nucleotide exchange factor GrpE [Chloroflexota bacterium]
MIPDSQSADEASQQIDEVVEPDPEPESSNDFVAEPANELEALREESARNYAGWQRAQADFENLKRRSAQDVRDRVQQSQRAILLDLLDLADDFERANRESPSDESNQGDPWRQGVELMGQKLSALLMRQQVKQIDTVDQAFDPDFHEAVGQLPGQHNEIVAVLRTGYTIGSRVLRATQVMVGDGSIEPPDPDDDSTDTPDETDEITE